MDSPKTHAAALRPIGLSAIVLAAAVATAVCAGPWCRAAERLPASSGDRQYFAALGSRMPTVAEDDRFPRVLKWPGGPSIQLRGRIDLDSIWTLQSAGNVFAYGELGAVVGLRRARVGVQGDLCADHRYLAEIDLASGEVVPRDIFVARGRAELAGERRIGHFREPFSLEGGTNANYFMFMERSPVNDLDPARAWGVAVFDCAPTETATLAVGVFFNGSGIADFEAGNNAASALTGRLTVAPLLEDGGRQLVHLGVASSTRLSENGIVTVNQHPRSALLDPSDSTLSPFVPTVEIAADVQQAFNVQLATCRGPFWTQAEWYSSLIPAYGGDLVFLHGGYASCGWFLTGEHRAYQATAGVLGPVSVARPLVRGAESRGRPSGWGAWELVARLSYLDYFDLPPGPGASNVGIRLPQATFGVNWYLADRWRLMFNYAYEVPDEANIGTSEASVFATRLNVFF